MPMRRVASLSAETGSWQDEPTQDEAEQGASAQFGDDDMEEVAIAGQADAPSLATLPFHGGISIEAAAERLIASGAARAIFISPEGDEAAATAVLVAREVADAGLRVLLLDLTASGAASRPMLDGGRYPGITNLLASEAQFTDVIRADHYSDCDVMPVGTADPMRAMRAADRLPIIMESLTTAYDLVVVECGPADAGEIRRLVSDGTEVLVSVLEHDDEVAFVADGLRAGGYQDVMLVTPVGHDLPTSPQPTRSAA
jgi:Mrp family chromosome partitioning ATPase